MKLYEIAVNNISEGELFYTPARNDGLINFTLDILEIMQYYSHCTLDDYLHNY